MRAQIAAIAFTVVLSALDGYDILSVPFAAPAITRSWGIDRAMLGIVLSSGLADMALANGFDDRARASGSGFVMGVGRISSAIAPLYTGELFAAHFSRAGVSAVLGSGALAASLLIATFLDQRVSP